MSLYYDAQSILDSPDAQGSLKSRIYNHKSLKCPPAQVYALVIEATKWSKILTEIINKTGLLSIEKKLNPTLALLLVHDHLLAKKGIAAPAKHPLRLSIERHKARLGAELVKARIRRKCGTIDSLRKLVESGTGSPSDKDQTESTTPGIDEAFLTFHPRWIRVNTIKSTLKHQLATTFQALSIVKSLSELFKDSEGQLQRLYLDEHIPNLVAVHPKSDFTKSVAYANGEIIFQDKASCFSAYLLDPAPVDLNIVDACAAPGNKTSHVVALLQESFASSGTESTPSRVLACERDKNRASILKKMMLKAGAQDKVSEYSGQDFLRTRYDEAPWMDATAILLDPSCSGSGMIGRDEVHTLELPSSKIVDYSRKRQKKDGSTGTITAPAEETESTNDIPHPLDESQSQRLLALSTFQLKLLLHAFQFPSARKIVYSTCSVHTIENEAVVCDAILSIVAEEQGWKILPRYLQVDGLKRWNIRGHVDTCKELIKDQSVAATVSEACIRCNKKDGQGTMGFFVAGFVRDEPERRIPSGPEDAAQDGSEWEGCEDES